MCHAPTSAGSSDNKAARSSLAMLLLASVMLLSACDGNLELEITSLKQFQFAQSVRPDLDIVTAADIAAAQYINDGHSGSSPTASAIVPPGVPGNGLFPAARILWVPPGTATLNYETILFELRLRDIVTTVTQEPFASTRDAEDYTVPEPRPPSRKHVTFNYYGVMTPGDTTVVSGADRKVVVASYDGDDYVLLASNPELADGFYIDVPGHTVALEQCHATESGDSNDASRLTQSCQRVDLRSACGSALLPSLPPWSVYGCELPVNQDTSFGLHVVSASNLNDSYVDFGALPGAIAQGPTPPMPTLKVVTEPRTLVRELTFVEETCRLADESYCSDDEWQEIRYWRQCQGRFIAPGELVDTSDCPINLPPPGTFSGTEYGRLNSNWTYSLRSGNQYIEQFSPDLSASNARLFKLAADGSREYLPASAYRPIDLVFPTGGIESLDVRFTRSAASMAALTLMTAPGVWELVQAENVMLEDLAVEPHDRVFLEFMLAP